MKNILFLPILSLYLFVPEKTFFGKFASDLMKPLPVTFKTTNQFCCCQPIILALPFDTFHHGAQKNTLHSLRFWSRENPAQESVVLWWSSWPIVVSVCCGSFCVEEADIFWFHTSFSRQICQNWEQKSQLTGRSANQTWHIQKQNASQHIVDSRVVATSQIKCVWEPEKDQKNFHVHNSWSITRSLLLWSCERAPNVRCWRLKGPFRTPSLCLTRSL